MSHFEHPAQPAHLHFFSQLFPFVAHHALHTPDSAGLVVVVSVSVLGVVAVVVVVITVVVVEVVDDDAPP